MTWAHITLLAIALLMALESVWVIARPLAMKDHVRQMLDEAGDDAGTWRGMFWGAAVLAWLMAWFGQTWAHRVLFFIGVYFMALGFLTYRHGVMEWWYDLFFGRRSAPTIRLLYFCELLMGAGLAWFALQGW